MTLIFNDPIAAKLYIQEFAPKSVKPVVAYLWTTKKPEAEYGEDFSAFASESEIRQLETDELIPELLDSDLKHIRINPAVYVKGYPAQEGATGGVLLLSHEQESGSVDYWSNTVILSVADDSSFTKLINQLTIEGDFVFNEKRVQDLT